MKIQVAILRAEKIKSTSGVSRVVCRDRAVICFLINEFNANKVTNHQRCTFRLNLAHLGTNIAVHWCNAELLCRPLSTCCSCLLSVGDTVKICGTTGLWAPLASAGAVEKTQVTTTKQVK